MLLLLELFVHRVQGDQRPVQEAVYFELGELIKTYCLRHEAGNLLPVELKLLVERLLRIEVASRSSSVNTYARCGALLERIYQRGLYQVDRFQAHALDFLNAATAQLEEADASSLRRSVDESLSELEGEKLNLALLRAMLRIEFDFRRCISSNARFALSDFVNDALDHHQEVRFVQSFHELGNFTDVVTWVGLSDRDRAKDNCVALVELLGRVIPDGETDFNGIDRLNARPELFRDEGGFYNEEF